MSKKVFICAHANFPRGDASANYIEYFAQAMIYAGYEVYIVSRGKNLREEWDQKKGCYIHKGILYENVNMQYGNKICFVVNYFREVKFVKRILKKFKVEKENIILFYTKNYFYIRELCNFAAKEGMKTAACITEWFQPFCYRWGMLNPVFWLDTLGFSKGIPMCGKVFPISEYLESYYKKKGCDTMCVPALAASTLQFEDKGNNDIIQFVYSGDNAKKDAIDEIIKTFASLNDNELKKVRLHFTGMSKESFIYLQKKCGNAMKRIRFILEIHRWMAYEDLVELYKKMDFLILLRKSNKITFSNFPSKVPEMMGLGIIPIVSQVGDYTRKYLCDKYDCIMVDGCSKDSAIKAVRYAMSLTQGERRQMQINAYNTVNSKFSYVNWGMSIASFLQSY